MHINTYLVLSCNIGGEFAQLVGGRVVGWSGGRVVGWGGRVVGWGGRVVGWGGRVVGWWTDGCCLLRVTGSAPSIQGLTHIPSPPPMPWRAGRDEAIPVSVNNL